MIDGRVPVGGKGIIFTGLKRVMAASSHIFHSVESRVFGAARHWMIGTELILREVIQ